MPARAARRHQGNLVTTTVGDQRRFWPHAVDGVNHIAVAFAHILRDVICRHKVVDHRDLTFRVDQADTLRHDLRLRQTKVIAQGVDLTVGVGDANVIHVNQRDCANTGSRQRFCRPRPHTTNAHDADMRIRKQLQGFFTI